MKWREQKGISGIDIIVSVLLITIFVTIATMVSGKIFQNRNRLSVGRQAVSYAISEIESLKEQGLQDLQEKSGYIEDTAFYKTVTIEDAKSILDSQNTNSQIKTGKLKKAIVKIEYKEAGTIKTIQLATMIY